jgi:hypothetical protein
MARAWVLSPVELKPVIPPNQEGVDPGCVPPGRSSNANSLRGQNPAGFQGVRGVE